MTNVAIRVENLSKLYYIERAQGRHDTLRDALAFAVRAPLERLLRGAKGSRYEAIWALKRVSFEVQRGEVVGIIGRNGAGKSTLLKVLSRITRPTEGRAVISGRVGSLLEVGTGFHPELTGRENIYLSGAILGMKRVEIDRQFDEIVEFSGVERFIDTPFKRYSSGMRVRLGFSVAAHLEPEILLVDEVLAVGDAAFQRKCLGKVGDVAKKGRTVLFVSHNMGAVQALCGSVLLLDAGRITERGDPFAVTDVYYESTSQRGEAEFPSANEEDRRRAYYVTVRMLDESGHVTDSFRMGSDLYIELSFETKVSLGDPGFGVVIVGPMGERLLRLVTRETHGVMPRAGRGGTVRLRIERPNLLPGTYSLTLGLSNEGQQIDLVENALQFDIKPWAVYPTGKVPRRGTSVIFAPCTWGHEYE